MVEILSWFLGFRGSIAAGNAVDEKPGTGHAKPLSFRFYTENLQFVLASEGLAISEPSLQERIVIMDLKIVKLFERNEKNK